MPYLRQIAYGQVLPEVIVRYAEQPSLVRTIASLPFPDQEYLSNGGKVELAVARDDGSLDHRLVDPLHLSRDQMRLVFARGRIRPPEEQIVLITDRPRRKAATPPIETLDGIRIDHKRRGLIIGRRFVPAATVVEALARLAKSVLADDEEEEREVQLAITLSAGERDRLRDAARLGNTKMVALARRALRTLGLI
jgi:hypothetical protein